MSLLDEIARLRRATASRRVGPAPDARAEPSPMSSWRLPASGLRTPTPNAGAGVAEAPVKPAAQSQHPPQPPPSAQAPSEPAPAKSSSTLESVLGQALASIAAAAQPSGATAAPEPVVVHEPKVPPEPQAPQPAPELAPARQEAEPAPAPEVDPAEEWVVDRVRREEGTHPDRPAPLGTEGSRQETPRYESWLPRPDLFKLTNPEAVPGTLEPLSTSAPQPVTSLELVPVDQPLAPTGPQPVPRPPGFSERTQLRRRVRFLRQLREVQLRDLGGFALELHRFGREKPELARAKLEAAAATDRELRQLEYTLNGRVELRVIREAGIGGACSHCGAVYGTEDRFCTNCGEPLPGTTLLRDDRPAQ